MVAPTVKPTNAPTTKQTVTPTIVPTTAPTTETTQLRVQETETKPVPEIKEEQNVTPKPNEEIANNREEALDKLDEEAKYLQEETDKGAADGKYYGENGMPKPSLDGKSDAYISAFNTSYDAWKAVYDAIHSTEKDELVKTEISTSSTSPTTTVEEYSLNDLNKDQLEELKIAALGEDEYAETKAKEKTK